MACELQAVEPLTQHVVDHPAYGIRTIDSRGAVGDDLDALHSRQGNLRGVLELSCPARRRHTTAIQQQQGRILADATKIERRAPGRIAECRKICVIGSPCVSAYSCRSGRVGEPEVAHLRQCAHRISDIGRAGRENFALVECQRFTPDRLDAGDVGTRGGDDHLLQHLRLRRLGARVIRLVYSGGVLPDSGSAHAEQQRSSQ